jgi:hypothetical protein
MRLNDKAFLSAIEVIQQQNACKAQLVSVSLYLFYATGIVMQY